MAVIFTTGVWVPQKLPQIYTVLAYICIGKVAGFAVYICGNIWNAQYLHADFPNDNEIIRAKFVSTESRKSNFKSLYIFEEH